MLVALVIWAAFIVPPPAYSQMDRRLDRALAYDAETRILQSYAGLCDGLHNNNRKQTNFYAPQLKMAMTDYWHVTGRTRQLPPCRVVRELKVD